MVNFDDATNELIADKNNIKKVATAAYICLASVKEDMSDIDSSFPDGICEMIVDSAVLRDEVLSQAEKNAVDRTMPVLNQYGIFEYGAYAYAGYMGIEKDITVGSGVVNIGKGCFRESFIDSITFVGRLGTLPTDLLFGSYVKSVTFSNTVALPGATGSSVFEGCRQLKTLVLPSNLQKISSRFCYNCVSLEGISFPNAAGEIGDYAFYGCAKLPSVNIPRGVSRISEYAFANCTRLESVTFGTNSVLSVIDSNAFRSCSSLTSITIPAGVTQIGTYAFGSCSSLTEIRVNATMPPTLGAANAFPYQNEGFRILIPAGTLEAYQNATVWKSANIKNKLVEMEA